MHSDDEVLLLADLAALLQYLAHGGGQTTCACGRPTRAALSPEALLLVGRIKDRVREQTGARVEVVQEGETLRFKLLEVE